MSEAPIGQSEQNESGGGECVKYMKQCLTKHGSCSECVGRSQVLELNHCPEEAAHSEYARYAACRKARREALDTS